MNNIILFNLLTLIYLYNRNFKLLFMLSVVLDIYTLNFIGVHALFALIILQLFTLDLSYSLSLFLLLFINLTLNSMVDIQTFLFYGYSQFQFSAIFILYSILCSMIFTTIYQKQV